jgi:hypothetical protein
MPAPQPLRPVKTWLRISALPVPTHVGRPASGQEATVGCPKPKFPSEFP